jgi:hypothetical protein
MTEDTLELTAKAFKRYRALARRRYNAEDYQGAIDAVQRWYVWLDAHPDAPIPDDWASMARIEQDAELKLRHRGELLAF